VLPARTDHQPSCTPACRREGTEVKILITGDRNYKNVWAIYDVLSKYDRDSIIIHGGARGADTLADTVAKSLGFKDVVCFPADWKKYGRGAGPVRNRQMLDENPNLVIAFHDDIENSKGTKDCKEEAEKRGIEVILISKIK